MSKATSSGKRITFVVKDKDSPGEIRPRQDNFSLLLSLICIHTQVSKKPCIYEALAI